MLNQSYVSLETMYEVGFKLVNKINCRISLLTINWTPTNKSKIVYQFESVSRNYIDAVDFC